MKVINKTPVDAFQIDANLKVPIVDLNTVQSDRSLKWTFTEPIDFDRISNHNINLKGLRVVKNSREIVQGIEITMSDNINKIVEIQMESQPVFSSDSMKHLVIFEDIGKVSRLGIKRDVLFAEVNAKYAFVDLNGTVI